MKRRRLTLENYCLGDVCAIEPAPGQSPVDQTAWRDAMPEGRAWTAREAASDRVIACMGVWNDDGEPRCWALVDRRAGLRTWGELLVLAATILARTGAMRATAGSEPMARVLERLGFCPGPETDFPRSYRRAA